MEEQCNKENDIYRDPLKRSIHTPGKERTRSPGPKVAKLLEVFSGSNKATEHTPVQGSETNEVRSVVKGFRSKEDKIKSARAARLNASYVEANKVINQLLETTVGEGDCLSEVNQQKTPEKPLSEEPLSGKQEPPSENPGNEKSEGGFDVQKFLSKYCSKASSPSLKDTPTAMESESPKPTAALAYLHLVSQRAERSGEKRNPNIGAKLQHLMSNFENLDDDKTTQNRKLSPPLGTSQIQFRTPEEPNAQTPVSDAPPGQQEFSQLTDNYIFSIKDQKKVDESQNEDERPGSSKKRKLDFVSSSESTSHNDDKGCSISAEVDEDDSAIDEMANEEEKIERSESNEREVLLSSFCEKMKEWVDDDADASEFQKLLLKQAAALRKQQEVPVEGTAFTFGKILENCPEKSNCGRNEAANSDVDQIDEGALVPLRKKCVDFNSSIDVKSETSDTFSNYSTGVEDAVFAKTRSEESIYSEVVTPLSSSSTRGRDMKDSVKRMSSSSPLTSHLSSSSIESQSAQSTSSSEYMALPSKISCDGFSRNSMTGSYHRDNICSNTSESKEGCLSSKTINYGSTSDSDCTLRSNEYEVSDVDCSLVSSTTSSAEQNAAIASVLMDEIIIQQNIIQQVSRALNIAESRNPLRNSMEQIEAERVLLAANARQNALKHELSILHNPKLFQNEICSEENGLTSEEKELACFGNVTVSNISIPLRRDELFHLQLIGQHIYYVCLVRYRTQVVSTQIVAASSNQSTTLSFANLITFRNVDPSFNLILEIWSYSCSQKTGSNKNTMNPGDGLKNSGKHQASEKRKASFLTSPFVKKSKSGHDSHGNSVNVKESGSGSSMSSPCSAPSYRKVGFSKVASLVLTRKNCSKQNYNLQQVTIRDGSFNPLKGTMSVNCELFPFFQMEYKGFLNMEDDKGKAIWRMRWCKLSNTKLTFWKFAENEHSLAPIGCIDLRLCEDIVEVSRLECAIPYAFALVLRQPPSTVEESDKCSRSFTKQLLCTDSKESRSEWIRNIRLVLVNLKTWTTD